MSLLKILGKCSRFIVKINISLAIFQIGSSISNSRLSVDSFMAHCLTKNRLMLTHKKRIFHKWVHLPGIMHNKSQSNQIHTTLSNLLISLKVLMLTFHSYMYFQLVQLCPFQL